MGGIGGTLALEWTLAFLEQTLAVLEQTLAFLEQTLAFLEQTLARAGPETRSTKLEQLFETFLKNDTCFSRGPDFTRIASIDAP